MSKFRKIVEEILKENHKDKIKDQLTPITYKQLLYIFCLNNNLNENKNDNKSMLWLARNTYKEFLNKIKNKDYEKTQFGGIVNIDDLDIEFTITGKSGDGIYSKQDNEIRVFIEKISDLETDLKLRNALIHEIAHSLSFDDEHNYNNYTSPEQDREKYLIQPLELEANKIAMLDYLVEQTLLIARQYYSYENLRNTEALQDILTNILHFIMQDEKHVYKELLDILSKDEQTFDDFYKEIIATCIEYIQEHLDECSMYSVINDTKRKLEEARQVEILYKTSLK